MRFIGVLVLGTVVLGLATPAGAADWRDEARKRLVERRRQLEDLQEHVRDFYEARARGDRDAAMQAAEEAEKAWQALPDAFRAQVEKKHGGVADRIKNLRREWHPPEAAGRSGQVTHEGTITSPNGRTVTREDLWTKEGNTLTREGTRTGPGGRTAVKEATWTKEGKTVTRDGSTTGPGGKKVTSHDTWTRDGNTVQRDGATTGPGGRTATRKDLWTREGNAVTREGTRTGPGGKAVTRHDTWKREGRKAARDIKKGGAARTLKKWQPKHKTGGRGVSGGRSKLKRSGAGGRGR